jgi:hypothetical protein
LVSSKDFHVTPQNNISPLSGYIPKCRTGRFFINLLKIKLGFEHWVFADILEENSCQGENLSLSGRK